MITENSVNGYNSIRNRLCAIADFYYQLKLDFMAASMTGFSAMAENEAMERWRLCGCIDKHLIMNGAKPAIGKRPNPPVVDTTQAALEMAVSMEKELIDFIEKGIINIMSSDPSQVCKMSEIYEKCVYELNEISGVKSKMGVSGATISGVDQWLDGKY